MGNSPSFYSLFSRSKFGGRDSDEESENLVFESGKSDVIASAEPVGIQILPRRQKERFSVAALAFCLSHVSSFRQCFLRCLLLDAKEDHQAVDQLLKEHPEIQVEPWDWADLLIEFPNASKVFVVEFKINAPLENHQNPWSEENGRSNFFRSAEVANDWKKKRGYGDFFITEARYKQWDKYYLILHQIEATLGTEWTPITQSGIRCRSFRWETINAHWSDKSDEIINDLFDTLGGLGVRTFKHRRNDKIINNMQTMESVQSGAQSSFILQNVAAKLALDSETWNTRGDWKDSRNWHLGVTVMKKKKGNGSLPQRHQKLVEIINPPGNDLLWYGYLFDEGKEYLDVWLYCREQNVANELKAKLQTKFSGCVQYRPEPILKSVVIRVEKHSSPICDQDWFVNVLESVFKISDSTFG